MIKVLFFYSSFAKFYNHKKGGENIKITDFNVSKFCDDYKADICKHIEMITYTGTIAFSAPELL